MSADDGFRKYVRVYYSIFDDPKFAKVYGDDAALATWLRLLLAADAMHPAPCPVPRSTRSKPLAILVEVGLIDLLPGDLFVVHGMAAERERRSQAGRPGGRASGLARSSRQRPSNGRSTVANDRSTNVQRSLNQPSLAKPSKAKPSRAHPPSARARAREDDPAEPIFKWAEARGVKVNRSNGHAAMVRDQVRAYGLGTVLATLPDQPVASLGDVAKWVGDRLRPRPVPPVPAAPTPPDYRMDDRVYRTRVANWRNGAYRGEPWDPAWGPHPDGDTP